ncbi:hypothetical protein ACSSS7_002679 [Eimeria intestinalis]
MSAAASGRRPPSREGPVGALGGKNARPVSRVEQMLHAYYALEETGEQEGSAGKVGVASEARRNEAQETAGNEQRRVAPEPREESRRAAQASAPEPPGGGGGSGALKMALQLLSDIPYWQQSVAAAANTGPQRGDAPAPPPPPELDLNSPQFNMQAFFSAAVTKCTLRQLLRLSNELEAEVRLLERDIQTLVYENYGKFLSATETVRRVRQAMGDVEGQLQSLSSSVASIENSSGQLMATVHHRAAGIEDLVAFRQLIEQLQWLSTLPELLRHHLLNNNDPETALLVYGHARVFLAEQHAPSSCSPLQRLALIRRDADAVAAYARKLLRRRLETCDTDGTSAKSCVQSEVYVHPKPEQQTLSTADASRIVRLLLRSGEEPGELLALYQRGRRRAANLCLGECMSRGRGFKHSADCEEQEAAAGAAFDDSTTEGNTGATFERVCGRLAAVYVHLLTTSLQDSLFILRFTAVLKAKQGQQGADGGAAEASEVRRARAAADTAESQEVSIGADSEEALLSFLQSAVEAAFSRLSAMVASTIPGAPSVVRGTCCFVTALEAAWKEARLPPSLLQRASDTARAAQRKLLLEAMALVFKRAYAKAAQELHHAAATAVQQHQKQQQQRQQQQRQQQLEQQEDGADLGRSAGLAARPAAAAVSRQAAAEHSIVVEGCVALTDAHQLLQGAFWTTAEEAEALVAAHTLPWVSGVFELVVQLAAHLTRDIPAASAGFPYVMGQGRTGAVNDSRLSHHLTGETGLTEPVGLLCLLLSPLLALPPLLLLLLLLLLLVLLLVLLRYCGLNSQAAELGVSGTYKARVMLSRLHESAALCFFPRNSLRIQLERKPFIAMLYVGLSLQVDAAVQAALGCQLRSQDAEWLRPEVLPLVCLTFLRVGRSLLQLGLSKVDAVGVELFPFLDAGWITNSSNSSISSSDRKRIQRRSPVASRLRAATQSLLTAYVFCVGQKAAEAAVNSLAATHWAHVQEGTTGVFKQHQPNDLTGTSGCLAPLVRSLHNCNVQLAEVMEDAAEAQLSPAAGGTTAQPQRRLGRPLGRRRTAIEREMERLFARKQQVFCAVPCSRTKAVMGVFRIAARAVLEFVRYLHFTVSSMQQLQVNCAAASCAIRQLVQVEDASVVDGFLDEVVASAAARCIRGVASDSFVEPHGALLAEAEVDAILNAAKQPL